EHFAELEVRMPLAAVVARRLELLGVLLDVLLLGVVALLLLGELRGERLDLGALGALQGRGFGQLRLEYHLLAPILMLADHLGLVEGPLVGGLLLGKQHLLHRVVAPERGDRQHDRVDRGRERGAAAECRLAALVDLLGVGDLDLSHATRWTLSGSPRAWRRGRPRTRS